MARRTASHRRRGVGTPARGGFTLLETSLALMIVLVGVLAIMEAQTAFIRSNNWSSHEATATYLANEIRERMRTLPRHDPVVGLTVNGGNAEPGMEVDELLLDDMDDIDDYQHVVIGATGNTTFIGPVDAFGSVIYQTDDQGFVVMSNGQPVPLQGWSQRIDIDKVHPYNLGDQNITWNTFELPAAGGFAGRAIDQYPLRVTVSIYYQAAYETESNLVTQMSWVTWGR